MSRATKKINSPINLTINAASVLISSMIIAACGGQVNTPNNQFSAPAKYSFVTPKAGAQSTFADTYVDNLNNTVNRTLVENITAVNADGSFAASWDDPSGSTTIAGNVDQTFYPTVVQYNNIGQTVSYVATPYSAAATSCTATPHLGEAPSPLTQAQNWTLNYSLACGSAAPISYSQVGAFQDMEQLIVPAGTFNAYRFTSVINYTDGGVGVSEYVSTWVNTLPTDSRVLQESVYYVYNGTAPQGAIMSDTKALSSYQ